MTDLECYCYAVGHGDEGVCLAIVAGGYRILLDCGIDDISPLLDMPVDAVICTHAHPDHAKGLQAFQKACPDVPIYTSEVTALLLPVQWLGGDRFPSVNPVSWRSPTEILPGLTLQLWPAGHLPGAACLLLTHDAPHRRQTVFYTGDCMLSHSRLVEGMPLDELQGIKPDVLIVDGSYGVERHARRKQQDNQLADTILRAIAQRYSIVLPTSRLGQGQELLMLLRSHHHFTGKDVDIWVSPGIAAGCDAYLELLPYFPASVQNFAQHQPLFWDDRIRPWVHRLPTEHDGEWLAPSTTLDSSTTITTSTQATILVTEPNVLLEDCCADRQSRWMILLPQESNHMVVGQTISAQIQASPSLQAKLDAGTLELASYELGEHCDGPALMQLIHSIRPQHVIFVHGSPHFLADLANQDELQTRYQLHLPTAGTRIELPIGDRFIQPAPPVVRYEGELSVLPTTVLLSLDSTIQDDVRWQKLADTGLIEAQWQGNDLLIRGVQVNNLLRGVQRDRPFPVERCASCLYCREQRCWNKASPLFGFRVTPDGSCPAFEPV
ncbi:MAG: MBL fold metallo-hydrolase [Merismopedia sp. SIO2A8]|nr:MBL fold metallo-hydrolase [Merismopedia sp. SIO2A8]